MLPVALALTVTLAASALAIGGSPSPVAPAGPINPLPATPYGDLPASATQPPSGEAVELLPTTVAVPLGAAEGAIHAGVGVRDATWHVGASAGQYAGDPIVDDQDPAGIHPEDPHTLSIRRSPSYAIQSQMSTRALVVEGTDGTRMALVTNDMYIPQDLVNQRVSTILKEHDLMVGLGLADGPVTGITDENMAVSVSHSHTSPYYSALAWGVWAFQDSFDIRFFEYLAQQMAGAVIDAVSELRPVRMGATRVPFDNTQRHSFGAQIGDDGSPAGYPQRDNDLGIDVLRFDDISDEANPVPYAVYATLGQHPEMLEGNNIVSGEWVQMVLTMVEATTGATPLFAQNNTGTSEPDRNGTAHAPVVRAEYSHREYAQAERGARQIANGIVTGMNAIGTATPLIPGGDVPYATDFPVAVADRQFAPPYSHPYPSVSNCRTHAAFDGQPGIPIVGLPDCDRSYLEPAFEPIVGTLEGTPLDPGLTYDRIQAAGIPLPENYGAPSYTGLQETFQVHLQVFRLGDVALTVCPCEQWADQSRNIKSRADDIIDNIHLGWDWTEFCTVGPEAGQWTCPNPNAVGRWDQDPSNPPPGGTLVITDAVYARMRAQVRNDALGWDLPENIPFAEAESADPNAIWGNYTHTELSPEYGYRMVMPIGMSNDYWGYIATYREYQRGDAYRKALTGLGAHSSDFLATRLVAMAGSLRDDPASTAAIQYNPLDLAYMVDGVNQEARATLLGNDAEVYVAAYEAELPADGGTPAVLAQPTNITRFDVAQMSWLGGSNYTDAPDVTVEREVAPGVWEVAGDMHGDVVLTLDFPDDLQELVADFRTGSFEWNWTAHWEAFDSDIDTARGNQTPTGTYRFHIRGLHREGTPSTPAPYELLSDSFTVSPWDGITVDDFRLEPDGTVSFLVGPVTTKDFCTDGYPNCGETVALTIGPIDYPDSWPEAKRPTEPETGDVAFPRLERHVVAGTQPYCFSCTFRPWADTGEVAAATVTITAADGSTGQVPATLGDDGRWHTSDPLGDGERAQVDRGGIVDTFGELNGVSSSVVAAGGDSDRAAVPAVPATNTTGLARTGSEAVLVAPLLLFFVGWATRRVARPTKKA